MKISSTTVVCVRRDGKVAIGADGQVTLDKTVLKHGAKKLRRLGDGKVAQLEPISRVLKCNLIQPLNRGQLGARTGIQDDLGSRQDSILDRNSESRAITSGEPCMADDEFRILRVIELLLESVAELD